MLHRMLSGQRRRPCEKWFVATLLPCPASKACLFSAHQWTGQEPIFRIPAFCTKKCCPPLSPWPVVLRCNVRGTVSRLKEIHGHMNAEYDIRTTLGRLDDYHRKRIDVETRITIDSDPVVISSDNVSDASSNCAACGLLEILAINMFQKVMFLENHCPHTMIMLIPPTSRCHTNTSARKETDSPTLVSVETSPLLRVANESRLRSRYHTLLCDQDLYLARPRDMPRTTIYGLEHLVHCCGKEESWTRERASRGCLRQESCDCGLSKSTLVFRTLEEYIRKECDQSTFTDEDVTLYGEYLAALTKSRLESL